jgi:antitoxin CptB
MTGSGETLELRRKRLRFRVWHRGMREVDLLLGRFADAHLEAMDEAEVAGFEALLDVPDPEILGWITGEYPIPPEEDSATLRRILKFHRGSD